MPHYNRPPFPDFDGFKEYQKEYNDSFTERKFQEEYLGIPIENRAVDVKLLEEINKYRIEIDRLIHEKTIIMEQRDEALFKNNSLYSINKGLLEKNKKLQAEVDKIHSRFDILDIR